MSEQTETVELKEFGWVMLELMGHRQRIGKASEEIIGGGKMLRIDIPTEGEDYATEFYGPSAIYSLRPISEEIAMKHWSRKDPRPVRPVEYQDRPQIENHDDDQDEDPF